MAVHTRIGPAKSVKRGGAALSPLRITQLVFSTALLIGAALAMLAATPSNDSRLWIMGAVMLILGTLLCFINIKE